MLQIQEILNLLNKKGEFETPKYIYLWRGVYFGMSLHIDGACPAFTDLRYDTMAKTYVMNTAQTIPNNYFGIEYQQIFDRYLFSRHPREPEITRQWRMSQYKPFTQEPFRKVIQVVTGAIFQDSGYTIQVDDKDDNDYIWGNNFEGKNLPQYVTDTFQNIAEDPNGVYVVIPKNPWYETTGQVEPEIFFVKSKYIKWHSKDEIIFERDEITWTINKIGYFRFRKDNRQYVHIDETQGGYYAHMMYRMPVIVAGGQWNSQGFYESHFQGAKAVADEYVAGKSAEQMVNKEASHPFIIEADTACGDCGGQQRTEHTCSCGSSCDICKGLPLLKVCSSCSGTGRMSRNPADRMIVPGKDMGNQLIQIVNPDVEVNKYHLESNAGLYKSMLEALHLNYIDQSQSGTAKAMDMETRYQFISRINNDVFDRLITELLDAILYLRNVKVQSDEIVPAKPRYVIVKPSQFQIKTSYDLAEEYKMAGDSNMPSYMLEAISVDYVDKQFGGNEALKKKTHIINQMDILAVSQPADISVMVLNNAATTRDWQFHLQLPKIIDRIIRERTPEWFIGASYDAIETIVNSEFAKIKPAPVDIIDETEERVNV